MDAAWSCCHKGWAQSHCSKEGCAEKSKAGQAAGHVAVESVTALRRNILWYSWYHPLRREPPPIVQLKFASIQRNTTRIV
jgi:hypothetical protein